MLCIAVAVNWQLRDVFSFEWCIFIYVHILKLVSDTWYSE